MLAKLGPGLDVSGLITERLDCTRYEQGFEVMRNGISGKVIFVWTTA
jgi:hypothetical protein